MSGDNAGAQVDLTEAVIPVTPTATPAQPASPERAGAAGLTGSPNVTINTGAALVTEDLLKMAEALRTITPKGTWVSLGSEDEIATENGTTIQRRPLTRVQFDVTRQLVLRHHATMASFITKEASEDSRDLRGVVNPQYDTMRDEVEVGVQAVRVRCDVDTQTHFARKVNAAVQAEPTLVDACIRHIEVPRKEDPSLMTFLDRALPRTLHNLTQNDEIPIYADDLSMFKEDDAILAARDEMVLVEKGNYVHAMTKDRHITSVAWRSAKSKDDYICVASIAAMTLEERIEAQRRCETSVSLVWEFSDPMHPRYILESPDEVQVLRFSPSRPNLIVGGALNGQVYLWDLSQADRLPTSSDKGLPGLDGAAGGGGHGSTAGTAGSGVNANDGQRNKEFKEAGDVVPMADSVKGVTMEKDGDVQVPRLQPLLISRVDLSHKRAVHDVQWLPSNVEFGFDGKQTVLTSDTSHQFVTVSDDGTMCVWDTRPEFLPQDKLRKMRHQSKAAGGDTPWVPLLRYQLTSPDGQSDVPAMRFSLGELMPDGSPSYTLAVGGTNGQFGTGLLVARNERTGAVMPAFGTTKDTRVLQTVVEHAHAGPVYALQRHPTIGDVYLTCGDHTFKVWRTGLDAPLYASPYLDNEITCAAWSPARAAVVFIGTRNGQVVVYDLLERNSDPLVMHHMVQDAISSIAFKPLPTRVHAKFTQHVAIGTHLGSFHWYVLPAALSRASRGERRNFRTMLEREARRVAYFDWRWTERQLDVDRYGASAPKMLQETEANLEHGAGHDGDEDNNAGRGGRGAVQVVDTFNFYDRDAQRDEEFLEMVSHFRQQEEERMRLELAI